MGLGCDVSKEQDVQRAFDTITKTCGPVGFLVNAAGINRCKGSFVYNCGIPCEQRFTSLTSLSCFRDALLIRCKPEDMVSVLHTNLLGSMLTCRAALRSMLSNGGAIVNVGEL